MLFRCKEKSFYMKAQEPRTKTVPEKVNVPKYIGYWVYKTIIIM